MREHPLFVLKASSNVIVTDRQETKSRTISARQVSNQKQNETEKQMRHIKLRTVAEVSSRARWIQGGEALLLLMRMLAD